MVERGVDRLPGGLDVGEVEHPSQCGVDVAAYGEFDPERMAVQARAGMGVGQRGQAPRALQVEDAEDVHAAFSRKLPALAMRTIVKTRPRSPKLADSQFREKASMFIPRLSAAVAALMFLLSINAWSAEPGPNLSAPEAYELIQAGKMTLIDIRRPEEWRQTGVAKDAHRINMEHPEGLIAFLRQVAAEVKGDGDAPIGLICRTGNRTTYIQQVMQEVGFTHVYNIKEGMIGSAAGPGWIARGLPVEPCPSC